MFLKNVSGSAADICKAAQARMEAGMRDLFGGCPDDGVRENDDGVREMLSVLGKKLSIFSKIS